MTPPTRPPQNVIDLAIETAMKSPCAKSKRGVVVYYPMESMKVGGPAGVGYNGMPDPKVNTCDGSDACKLTCAKRCVHAEDRAIRDALVYVMLGHAATGKHPQRYDGHYGKLTNHEAVHVKVVDGKLVWGGGPSCWQCSRTVLEVGLDAFWLYERVHKVRCPHSDMDNMTCAFGDGLENIGCRYCEWYSCMNHPEVSEIVDEHHRYVNPDDPSKTNPAELAEFNRRRKAVCQCSEAEAHAGLPPIETHWVRYTADEFHRITLQANGIDGRSYEIRVIE